LILEELPHTSILPPPIPNHGHDPFVFVLPHPHPEKIFFHEMFISSEPLLGLLSNLSLSEVLLSHEVGKIADHSHALPVLSSLRSRVGEIILELHQFVPIVPSSEGVSDPLGGLMAKHGPEDLPLMLISHALLLVPLELNPNSLVILLLDHVKEVLRGLILALSQDKTLGDGERFDGLEGVAAHLHSHHVLQVGDATNHMLEVLAVLLESHEYCLLVLELKRGVEGIISESTLNCQI
jgi:hypothetical protein